MSETGARMELYGLEMKVDAFLFRAAKELGADPEKLTLDYVFESLRARREAYEHLQRISAQRVTDLTEEVEALRDALCDAERGFTGDPES